jgi:multicomponent Na+:H+ antiporter subunit G
MAQALDILSWIFLSTGSFFVIVGGIGLLRLPDFYTRIHAASVTDTVGSWLVVIGLMLQAGLSLVTVKLILVLIFLVMTSPLASHALAKAAYSHGLKPWRSPDDRQKDQCRKEDL